MDWKRRHAASALAPLGAPAAILALVTATACPRGEDAQVEAPEDPAGDDAPAAPAAEAEADAPDEEGTFAETSYDTEYEAITLDRIAHPLEHPWAVAPLPDGGLLVTERPGTLHYLADADAERVRVDGTPEVHAENQGGLLEVVPHPEFSENDWVYLTYSKLEEGGGDTATALARARFDAEAAALEDFEEIFVQDRYSSPGRHYGSRVAFLGDGTLLVSVGDRGTDPPRAQDLDDHAGTLLRLEDDGAVPEDNPFVDDPDVLDEIYAYGLRNIQGLVVDPDDDTVWVTDHGPRGGDLIQRVEAGQNYGWPIVTQGWDYRDQSTFPDAEARSMEGVEDPFHEFFPTHAPSGLALVTAGAFPMWAGDLLAGGLRAERIRRVVLGEDEVYHEEELLLEEIGRIRDVREGPEGDIWVVTDEEEGALYRLSPES